jgi:hypothetical protein
LEYIWNLNKIALYRTDTELRNGLVYRDKPWQLP